MRLTKKQYLLYLGSDEWKKKRVEVLSNPYYGRPNECFICKSTKNLHIHHLTYIRLAEERDDDLCILCGVCHEKLHTTTKGEFQSTNTMLKVFEMKCGIFRDAITATKVPRVQKKYKNRKRSTVFTRVKFSKPSLPDKSSIKYLGTFEYYAKKK